ncbi:hypothetical protein M8J77_019042 [Diaphorina citri]|nr:hypothetical protein M8J77_019042 [Diaphorina citri]
MYHRAKRKTSPHLSQFKRGSPTPVIDRTIYLRGKETEVGGGRETERASVLCCDWLIGLAGSRDWERRKEEEERKKLSILREEREEGQEEEKEKEEEEEAEEKEGKMFSLPRGEVKEEKGEGE